MFACICQENEELRVDKLKDERIRSLLKTIEELKHEQSQTHQDNECQSKSDIGEEKSKLLETSSLDQPSNVGLLAKVTSLEIQLLEQRDILNSKDLQIKAQAETIKKQEIIVQENQDVIQEQRKEIIALKKKNTQLESVLLRMETVVEKSNLLQEEYYDEMTKLQAQTQEQDVLLGEKENQINGQSL